MRKKIVPIVVVFIAMLCGFACPRAARAQAKVTAWQVTLKWIAPALSSDPVASYKALRAPGGSSSYQQINTSAIPSTTTVYIDDNIAADQVYDYVVESVDASGNSSVQSNMVEVAIPGGPATLPKPTVVFNP